MWDFNYRRRLARTRSGERLSRDIEISKKSLRRQATKNGKNGNRSQLHHSIPRFTRQPWHTTTCSSSPEGFWPYRIEDRPCSSSLGTKRFARFQVSEELGCRRVPSGFSR